MPEWTEEIRKRLATLKLAPTRETEIVKELTQHVEDHYRELLSGGATEGEAYRMVLEELSDHELLLKGLRRVEQSVTQECVACYVVSCNKSHQFNGLEGCWGFRAKCLKWME